MARSFTATKGWVDPGNELFHRADGIIHCVDEVICHAKEVSQSDDAVIYRNNGGFRSGDAVIDTPNPVLLSGDGVWRCASGEENSKV